jgi:hypothetical protein
MVMAKVKVSQATIDKIKKMGMTAALKKAPSASPEMKEALTRMYGARRVAAAGGKPATKPAAKSADAARSSAVKPKSVYKSADAARSAMPGRGPAVTMGAKKSGTTDPFAKAVFGVGRAISNNGAGMSTRKPVAGKPSVGEKISAAFTGKGVGNRATAESVAAINAKRQGISVAEYKKRLATATAAEKAKKNK